MRWVALSPPGVDDERVRLHETNEGLLAPAVRTLCLDSTPGLTVDVLAFPGPQFEQYLLKGTGPNSDAYDAAGRYSRGTRRGVDSDDTAGQPALTATADVLTDALPDRIGLALVDVDMAPVGCQPTATLRVVETAPHQSPFQAASCRRSFAGFLSRLHDHGIPHVARARFEPQGTSSLRVRQQVAFFGAFSETLSPHDKCRVYGADSDRPHTVYDVDGVTTTLALFRNADLSIVGQTDAPRETLRLRPGTERAAALKRLVCGPDDYAWLLTGADDRVVDEDPYAKLAASPLLTVPAGELAARFGYAPNYGGCDWSSTARGNRHHPAVSVARRLREPTGTAVPTTTQPDAQPPHRRPTRTSTVAATGVAWQRFHERGDTLTVPSDGEVAGAFTRASGGTDEPVIVADGDLPAARLAAIVNETAGGVTVVTDTAERAARAYAVARTPVRPTDAPDGWVGLYTHPGAPVVYDGHVAVVPDHVTPAWQVNAEGDLEAVWDETVLAAGTLSAGLHSTRVRWVRPTETGCTLLDAGGDPLASEVQPATVAQTHNLVRWPVVPRRRSCHPQLSVYVAANGRLRYSEPTIPHEHQWGTRGEIHTFIERHTRPGGPLAGTLSIAAVTAACRTYCRPVTDCPQPRRMDIAHAINHIDDTARTQSRVDLHAVDGFKPLYRQWRWPTQDDPPFLEIVGNPDGAAAALAHRLAAAPSDQ